MRFPSFSNLYRHSCETLSLSFPIISHSSRPSPRLTISASSTTDTVSTLSDKGREYFMYLAPHCSQTSHLYLFCFPSHESVERLLPCRALTSASLASRAWLEEVGQGCAALPRRAHTATQGLLRHSTVQTEAVTTGEVTHAHSSWRLQKKPSGLAQWTFTATALRFLFDRREPTRAREWQGQ